MSQGEFTKEEATATEEAVKEIWEAIPKRMRPVFVGHMNDIFLFLAAAKRVAPSSLAADLDSGERQPIADR